MLSYLEDMVVRYNPRVVIVDEQAFAVLRKKYSLENHIIDIIGKKYPFKTFCFNPLILVPLKGGINEQIS